jgi:hypothetical protein
MPKFQSHWRIILLNLLVLTFERDSYIFMFLNDLNLTYQRLTGFVMSFDFITIVLVPWEKFLLCYTFIRLISAFWDQISILIVGYVTTWSRGSHQLVSVYPNIDKYLYNFLVKFQLYLTVWFGVILSSVILDNKIIYAAI